MKKRLFITTGSISLINAISLIKQTKEKESEDTLIILSFSLSDEFKKTNEKIASLVNFKKILYFKKESEIARNINFKDFDEVYSTTAAKLYKKLNNHKNVFIFDEGPGSVRTRLGKFNNIKGIYSTKFIDKFSFVDPPKNAFSAIIDVDVFNKTSKDVLNLFSLANPPLLTNKNVLFIGHYIYRALGDETALSFYKKYIDYFISKGYSVYFKAHPRDNDIILPKLVEDYKNNSNFNLLNNSLPIEIYDFNFDIIAGSYSGTLVSIPHYRKIPAIHLPLKELYSSSVGLGFKQFFALYDEYIPRLDEMEEVIGLDKETIYEKYLQVLKDKPELKDNLRLKKILLYKPNVLKDVFFGFLALFFKKEQKKKLKDIARSDFYKLL